MEPLVKRPRSLFQSPRKRSAMTSRVLDHFDFLGEETDQSGNKLQFYKCQVCDKKINGTSDTNLTKHMKTHKQVYKEQINPDFGNQETIPFKRLKLLQNLVEIVTVNGRPFKYLLDSGFLKCISDHMTCLKLAGCPINLSDPHLYEVKDYIHKVASEFRTKVMNEVKKKPIALMIDVATKNGRSILGISIQYMLNNRPKTVPIGIKELKEESTGKNLAKIVADNLAQYEISMAQVLTCTTDNGSNMLTMTDELDIFTNEFNANENAADADNDEVADDMNIGRILQQPDDDDAILDEIFDENALYEEMLNELVEELRLRHNSQTFSVDSIRCAAHTLQLAVKDALDAVDRNTTNVIELSNRVAKFLHRKKTKDELRKVGIKTILPKLNVVTRWSSTYIMLRSILRCKIAIEHFKSEKSCELLLKKWHVIIELVKVLKSAYLATISLQKSDVTLTDFFGCVKVLEIKLKQQIGKVNRKTNLVEHLLSKIDSRMQKLINTPLMICAMYLDPRYNCELKNDSSKILMAKLTLLKMMDRLKKITNPPAEIEQTPQNITAGSINSNISDLSDGNMDSYLIELDKHYEDEGVRCLEAEEDIAIVNTENTLLFFDSYDKLTSTTRSKSSESVFEIWKRIKPKLTYGDELYQMASALFGIPPTQAAVERLFSALNYVFTNRRHNLGEILLEEVLLLHTNKSFVESIFVEQLEQLVNKQLL